MSCCANTVCIDVYLSPCATSVDTGLVASVAGNWIAIYEFNGVDNQINVTYALNDPIILPNQFNPSYRHSLKLFKPDGNLFNDTCYVLNTHLTLNGNGGGIAPVTPYTVTTNITYKIFASPNPTAGDGSDSNPYQVAAGASITIPQVINKVVHEPQIYNTGNEYLDFIKTNGKSTDGVFTREDGNLFYVGDKITISYEA